MEKESVEKDYISFIAILKNVASKRRFIFRLVGLFLLIGLFVAIFSPKEYQSSVKFLSQNSASVTSGKSWSGLAALVGINLNSGSEDGEIPANIYPKIINSLPFQRKLMQVKLDFKEVDTAITFEKYYRDIAEKDLVSTLQKYTIGLPGTIVKSFKSETKHQKRITEDSLIFIDKKEERIQNILRESVLFSIDETDGVISITTTLPQPIPAAQLATKAESLLQEEIISYRIAKAQDQMNFINRQYEIQQESFKSAQANLAYYKDRNLFNTTQVAQTRLQELQTDYDLSYSVFSELQRQKVAQDIQIRKDTPIFTTINPATVANEPSSPNRMKIIIIALFLGIVISVGIVLMRSFIRGFKKTWKEADDEIVVKEQVELN